MGNSFGEWGADKRLKGLVFVVLSLVAVALIAYTYLTIREGRYVYSGPTTISVRGVGEVTRIPDIATFSFAVEATAGEPNDAQNQSATAVNAIIAYLKEAGVEEKDVKTTSYNLSPKYEYSQRPCLGGICPGGESKLVGYTVNQMIEVKVRDTKEAGNLISGVGERGATNVSSVQFTVDDDADAKAEARAEAVRDAEEKAKTLADTLGVRIVRLTGFWEEEGGGYPMYDKAYGGAMDSEMSVSPSLPAGENTVQSVVNLNYEIR